jgi:glycosyltransferase involved in cell wall biosynthesis
MKAVGVYLETSYKITNGTLFCQDIYINILNSISNRNNVNYNFLVKINKFENGHIANCVDKIFYLKPYPNLFTLIWKFPVYRFLILNSVIKFVDQCDTLIIMIPSPISKLVFNIAKARNKKIILLVRQDIVEMNRTRYVGFKKYFANYFSNYYHNYFLNFLNESNIYVITSGEKLAIKYLNYSNNVYSFADSRYLIHDIISKRNLRNISFSDKIHFLFVGRLEVNKGIFLLLEFAKKYSAKILLTIIGDGLLTNFVQNYILENNLSNTIVYLGHIEFGPNLLNYYKKSDFFIFPSYSEGLPQVILEAMACGCVIFSSNVGSIPTIVKNGFNGILFNPYDENDFYNKANMIFNNEFDLDKFRTNSLDMASFYAFENQIIIFEKILND